MLYMCSLNRRYFQSPCSCVQNACLPPSFANHAVGSACNPSSRCTDSSVGWFYSSDGEETTWLESEGSRLHIRLILRTLSVSHLITRGRRVCRSSVAPPPRGGEQRRRMKVSALQTRWRRRKWRSWGGRCWSCDSNWTRSVWLGCRWRSRWGWRWRRGCRRTSNTNVSVLHSEWDVRCLFWRQKWSF